MIILGCNKNCECKESKDKQVLKISAYPNVHRYIASLQGTLPKFITRI